MDGNLGSAIDPNAPHMEAQDLQSFFVAGDPRANENVLLVALHNIFVREHNRWCDELSLENPAWDDERLYQEARRRVSALLQHITYEEWLPIMGVYLDEYQGYDPSIDARISNTFSAAAFRLGHTLLSTEIIRLNDDGTPYADGNLSLFEAFFNPLSVAQSGLDPLLKGLGSTMHQEADCRIIDDVRNFLFGPPGAGGLDLGSINIQRARERGVPDFNALRIALGLEPYTRWSQITSNPNDILPMATIYGDINEIDPWVGLLAEESQDPNVLFGPTLIAIIKDQFQRLRDGDRFYYQNDDALTDEEKRDIAQTSFHDVIMRNSDIKVMQKELFRATPHEEIPGALAFVLDKELDIVTFPNPTIDLVYVKVFTRQEKNLSVRISDAQGRTVRTDQFLSAAGRFVHDTNVSDLPPGYYTYTITDGVETNYSSFIKQ